MFYKNMQWLYEECFGDWFFPYQLSNTNIDMEFIRLMRFYTDSENPYMNRYKDRKMYKI